MIFALGFVAILCVIFFVRSKLKEIDRLEKNVEYYTECIREQNQKLNLQESKLKKSDSYSKALYHLLQRHKGYFICDICHDKNGEKIFIFNDTSFGALYAYQFNGEDFIKRMTLMYQIYGEKIFDSQRRLKIFDIQSSGANNNRGIGTILLQLIEKIAKENNCRSIIGELSWVDADTHQDRLHYFYEKNGYKITMKDNHEQKQLYADILKVIS